MEPSKTSEAPPSFDWGSSLASVKNSFIRYDIAGLEDDNSPLGCSLPVRPGYGRPKREDQDRVAAFPKKLPPSYVGEGLPLERATSGLRQFCSSALMMTANTRRSQHIVCQCGKIQIR
eukprot:TRINITY_DN15516_c0_g1_i1.p2 TRINITY_DN15516_c0_g1~~TRINITY_DN15516_c0_g1_i1.p2  ORF type:complete len:118 (-),score=6.82 TRINITY_DN15516_c0_g1_i1:310-663(-)